MELTNYFLISQVLILMAMLFDFLSFQFKKRQHSLICFAISASLISLSYFFLGKIAAGVIIIFSVMRFITGYFTINKKFMYLFLGLNAISLLFTYSSIFDIIILLGISMHVIGTFQKDNKLMRKFMMVGSVLVIIYNTVIFSPMGVIMEFSFLVSNVVGYYRHYIKKDFGKRKKH